MSITRMGLVNLKLALIVAIRFSATRRQFGPKEAEEIPVLEYQLQVRMGRKKHFKIIFLYSCRYLTFESGHKCLHIFSMLFQQWRLIPYLAAAYALEHFTKSIFMNFVEFQIGQIMKDKSDRQVSINELHVSLSRGIIMYKLVLYVCCICFPGRDGQRDSCHRLL